VGTPIGNLEDITLRALRVLKECALVACEDTRQTRKLLDHYAIAARTLSYHEHNEMTRAAELVLELELGASVALVSDAGMPGISDPGYRLVALAVRHHIPVVPVPGPSALVAALAASGLATDSFHFGGFLPARPGARRAVLQEIRKAEHTEVFYESPQRLRESLEDVAEVLGPERPVVVARELTKIHEEFLRGGAQQVLAQLGEREVRGEVTLLIGKAETGAKPVRPDELPARMRQLLKDGLDEKAAMKSLAKETGLSKSEVYRRLQRSR
jgi:16S rRNA (cytidine1402-2'-O)-methyltransferase